FNPADFTGDTNYGSEYAQPAKMNTALSFIQKGGKSIRELQFSFEYEAFKANDLTLLAEHMYRRRALELSTFVSPPFQRIVWQPTIGVLWCVDTNGGLTAVTRDQETGMAAWHAHRLGGSDGDDPAFVESATVVRAFTGDIDELWLCVRRTINGSTKYY